MAEKQVFYLIIFFILDLWALGVFLFEIMTGMPPFVDMHRNWQNIAKKIQENKVIFPPYISSKTVSLIKSFMKNNPSERLGAKSFDDIKNHEFFEGIDW